MLTTKKIVQYAIIGLTTRIQEVEKSILRGQEIIKDRTNGKKDKSPKSTDEIKQIIKDKEIEMENLIDERNELEWSWL